MKTWIACDHGDYGDNGGQCIVILGEDKRIALVLGPDTPETRKNADLISAAPDMLEALRELLRWSGSDESIAAPEIAARKFARAAIRKATGGEGGAR